MDCCFFIISTVIFLGFIYVSTFLSKTVNFYTKYAVFGVYVMICGLITIPFAIFKWRDVANMVLPCTMGRVYCKYIGKIGPVVRGKENLPSGPCIIMCNHQSSIDIAVLLAIIPSRTTVLAKNAVFYYGPFGFATYLCGMIYIDRLSRDRAIQTMNRVTSTIKNEKISLFMFPEGTRNRESGLLPFKKGAFHVAVQAEVPVVPVVLSSYAGFYSGSKRIWNEGLVEANILKPIPTVGLTSADINNLVEKTRNQMVEVFAKSQSAEHKEKAS